MPEATASLSSSFPVCLSFGKVYLDIKRNKMTQNFGFHSFPLLASLVHSSPMELESKLMYLRYFGDNQIVKN